jgi:hypothetical protein
VSLELEVVLAIVDLQMFSAFAGAPKVLRLRVLF